MAHRKRRPPTEKSASLTSLLGAWRKSVDDFGPPRGQDPRGRRGFHHRRERRGHSRGAAPSEGITAFFDTLETSGGTRPTEEDLGDDDKGTPSAEEETPRWSPRSRSTSG